MYMHMYSNCAFPYLCPEVPCFIGLALTAIGEESGTGGEGDEEDDDGEWDVAGSWLSLIVRPAIAEVGGVVMGLVGAS